MTKNGASISPEARDCLQRVLQSDAVSRAPRVREVLGFVIERLLAGEADTINEESIGQRVFGRPGGYNRSEDNIVRVTVRHLRARLEEYYGTEGRGAPWLLEIPKGNYVPVLRPRLAAAIPDEPPPIRAATPARARPVAWTALPWVLCGVLAAGYPILLFMRAGHSGSESPNRVQGLAQTLFFGPGQRVSVVPTDANLQVYRMMFQKTVPLGEYIERNWSAGIETGDASPALRGALRFVRLRTETSLASALVIQQLQRAAGPAALRVRHPRELTMRDFQQDSAILLGGPWINPWGQLFEDRLNFRLVPPPEDAALSQIVNLKPEAGEAPVFRSHADGGFSVSYARVAMLPNLSENGKIVLVGATDHGSIEAGGQFLVTPASLTELLRRFGVADAASLPYFEVVLEVRSVSSTPREVHVIASRVIRLSR